LKGGLIGQKQMEEDNIEDEMEKLDEEIDEEIKEDEEAPSRIGKKKSTKEVQQPTERYVGFYQEAKIGIIDTTTGGIIVEGLPSLAIASLEAIKLNKLDKIEISSGA